MNIRRFKTASERRIALAKDLNLDLKNIGNFSFDESSVINRNCENMIGVSQIPMGIAGPIKIENQDYYIPLATTEGALVASINRGCKAITECGGALIDTKKVGTTRGPVFLIKNLKEKKLLENFLEKNLAELKKIATASDPHITLNKFNTTCAGRNFYVRFVFDTENAMGMNMATIATEEIANFIENKIGIKCVSISGNYCIDKKPAWLNFVEGRGFKVWAEILLSKKVLHEVLKTSAKELYDVWLAKCMTGSALAGSLGFNAHFANTVAAIFLATGQDPAHVVEGSMGITTAEVMGENLYASIYMPALMVGVIGGGTGLATQKEALSIIGIDNNNGQNSQKLAAVVAGTVLAGEISLLASLSEESLITAHKKLGRGQNL